MNEFIENCFNRLQYHNTCQKIPKKFQKELGGLNLECGVDYIPTPHYVSDYLSGIDLNLKNPVNVYFKTRGSNKVDPPSIQKQEYDLFLTEVETKNIYIKMPLGWADAKLFAKDSIIKTHYSKTNPDGTTETQTFSIEGNISLHKGQQVTHDLEGTLSKSQGLAAITGWVRFCEKSGWNEWVCTEGYKKWPCDPS
jgi:hypothetical protein